MKRILFVSFLWSGLSLAQDCPDSCSVFIPNAWTPNCKETDCEWLMIQSNCDLKISKFILYNRWGEAVFTRTKKNLLPNAKDHEVGTYFYILEGEFCNGMKLEEKGNVTLLK